MVSEKMEIIDLTNPPIGKLISIIAKMQTRHLNHKLNEFGINSTQLHLLYIISHQCNINQENIANRCNINKGAVARSIKKLEDKELVIREIDTENRRQNKVSLTKKGEDALNEGTKILKELEKEIFDDLSINKNELQNILKEIAINLIEMNEMEVKT